MVTLLTCSSVFAQKTSHPDFRVQLLAQVPDIEHPSVVQCDDLGNLFVGENPMDMRGPTTKEFDRILYITFNADGSVKRKTVFAENLSAVFGMIWHDGALYVMHAPHYTMLKDTDGDGVADVRKDLAKGFGPPAGVYGFNDHIVTGTHLGMDGFVYISVGDKGIQRAYSLTDKSQVTLEGGGVVRMKLDGTQLENFSSGTRNHLDTAMDSLDNLFTYDNTDDGLGWWTRFTYHMPTGYYGYPYDYLTRPQRHLPRLSEHGGGSPVGGSGYREAAWPEKYRDAIFYCEWGKGKVQVFYPKKNGASFDVKMEDFLVREGNDEFRPLDLCFSPDGKHMYLADWNFGGWVNPKRAGRLFRITYVGDDAKPVPASPFMPEGKAPADPRPPASSIATETLIQTLQHPAHSQRMLAQWELVKRGEKVAAPVAALLKDKNATTLGRVHAAWVLYQIAHLLPDVNATGDLVFAMHNGPPELRAQAARAIGTGKLRGEGDRVIKGLLQRAKNDTDATVRMHAAVALGRLADPAAAAELFASLDDADAFARFAKVQALRAINKWDIAPGYANASEASIREGTILALTGVYEDDAVAALASIARSSPHVQLRAAAVEAIAEVHRKAEPYTKGWWGTQPARGKPARPKKNEWSGTKAVLDALAAALKDESAAVVLAAIKAQQEIGDPASLTALRGLVTSDKAADIRAAAMRALAAMKDRESLPVFMAMARDAKLPDAARLEAVKAVAAIGGTSAGESLASLVKDDATPPALMAAAVEAVGVMKVAGSAGAVESRLAHSDKTVRAKAAALAAMPDRRSLPVLLDYITDKSADVRKDAAAALGTLRGQIIEDVIALHKANELRPEARRELGALFSTPKPIAQWHIIGAWPKEGPQPKFDFAAGPALDAAITIDKRELKWKKISTPHPQGMVAPGEHVDPDSSNWAIAYAEVKADAAGNYAWSLGSDDQAVLYVNGKKVFEHTSDRGWSPDANRGSVQLAKGINHVYFQTGNTGGPWQFSFAIGGPDPRLDFLYKDVPPQLDLAAYRAHATKNKGDALRGKQLFFDVNGVGCVKCHAGDKEGTATVGPNLLQIGAKYPREELIRSILEPSNRIVSGYEQTLIETDEGDRLSGIVRSESDDSIEFVDASAKTITLKKKQVIDRRKSTLSMMPNGLEKGLTLRDFADLVAYLEGVR